MPQKKAIDCLVLTPVGPNADFAYVRDTVESFLHYMAADRCVMAILDDTRTHALARHLPDHPSLRIVTARQPAVSQAVPAGSRVARLRSFARRLTGRAAAARNTRGQLFVKQMRCLTALGEEFDWRCMLRLDDDALVIGPDPQTDALRAFEVSPRIGMLGAYLRRGDGGDKQAAMKEKAESIDRQLSYAEKSGQSILHETLQTALRAADANGYIRGYMCTGGAFFIRRQAFDGFGLGAAALESAAGYRMHDFSDASDIMAINWRGLPMPLSRLAALGKKLVHPVKDLDDADHERQVREFFRARREAA